MSNGPLDRPDTYSNKGAGVSVPMAGNGPVFRTNRIFSLSLEFSVSKLRRIDRPWSLPAFSRPSPLLRHPDPSLPWHTWRRRGVGGEVEPRAYAGAHAPKASWRRIAETSPSSSICVSALSIPECRNAESEPTRDDTLGV